MSLLAKSMGWRVRNSIELNWIRGIMKAGSVGQKKSRCLNEKNEEKKHSLSVRWHRVKHRKIKSN